MAVKTGQLKNKVTNEQKKELNEIFPIDSVVYMIEYIARKTKNHRDVVVNAIGKERLQHIYELADVYHCENIDKITDKLISDYQIEEGVFDNITNCRYSIPTHWDIGKVYKRLIIDVYNKQNKEPIYTLIEVYNSWISRKIEDFNSSMYYETPSYLYESYIKGEPL